MNWARRSSQPELLDDDGIPDADLVQNLRELNRINTLLGGHCITRNGLKNLLAGYSGSEPVRIAEIGCGGGDNLRIISQLLDQIGIPYALTGIDLKAGCIAFAKAHSGIPPERVTWLCSDYAAVPFPENKRPHILFSSLFCHHFASETLVAQVRWLAQNSQLGFFINDLHRHPLAYHSIRLLTRVFSKSYLVRNDAPVSVLRSFRKADWQDIFRKAALPQPVVSWQWAFRYLVIHHSV
ncbi:MAG: methyltransferase domain-containing protein [Sphingobacteriales bacterium]|nr:MAG: methyltransferase domain-containing protein [Sphingobacteriales bacterium]